MTSHALQVLSDDPGHFRWVVLHVDGERVITEMVAECYVGSYEAALNAGTLALAAADEQPYENEAADPVGDADCVASSPRTGA
ncbi:hypothetical protein GT347_20420 [Xylophilus rhododendri]|uniref:DUF1508 domain-containing protein n=1 Tax=Xylophilus rhododendri TaxID=2697032 RepID=A0A857J8T7_9BURK|nr:hypothetical protein [Xylophilus rhododendri]QHJ00138.1 hypothetical protein GT347_20420 [Xylophilus rhododendri]